MDNLGGYMSEEDIKYLISLLKELKMRYEKCKTYTIIDGRLAHQIGLLEEEYEFIGYYLKGVEQ
jgi:hypothetical protein